jgi:hypothetical protein
VDDRLSRLAQLLRQRDELDGRIAALTGRAARQGDVGEFIASMVFDIELAGNAVQAGFDGRFQSGPLRDQTVNIKTYGDATAGLDISPHPSDFYLALSGPPRAIGPVQQHPWGITAIYLFNAQQLLADLAQRGAKIGVATSLRRSDLLAAQIFPATGSSALLTLAEEQVSLLSLFCVPGLKAI